MGDLPADPRRPSSPLRKGGMTGNKVNPRDPAGGNASGRPIAREAIPDTIAGGPRPAIAPYDARTPEPGPIGAIARLIASAGDPSTRAPQSDATGWGSVPDPGEIARKLIDDKAAGPGPIPGQGLQHPPDGPLHGQGSGHPALARLMDAGPPARPVATAGTDIQPPAHSGEAQGPHTRPDLPGHNVLDPGSRAPSPSGSGLPIADGHIALAGAGGQPLAMDFAPIRAMMHDRGMGTSGPAEIARPSGPVNAGGTQDPGVARHVLMPSGSFPAPLSWAGRGDAGPPQGGDRAQARPIDPIAGPDHLVGPSGASRRGILGGFDQDAVGPPDRGPQNAPWSGGPAAWGGPASSDRPAMAGRVAGGSSQPDLSRTNDLLQQILDEVRKDQKGFLPVADRNYNKYLEY
jgi:hypothetical protein